MKLDIDQLNKGIEAEMSKTSMMSVGIPAAARAAAPSIAGTAGKTVAKYAPVVGGLVHGGLAVNDAMNGDWTGAAMNTGSGIASGLGLTPLSVGLDVANAGRSMVGSAGNWAGNAIGNTVGKYAPLAMAGIAALGGGNKARQSPMYALPYNGPRPQSIINPSSDPHSLAAPQMFQESLAGTPQPYQGKLASYVEKTSGVMDAFAGAAARKAVDNVFNAAVTPEQPAPAEHKEKELEITSQYPEIAELLKDEQNKAYLQKLLNT